MIRKGNVTIGLQTRFGPDWTGIRCGARTKLGGECQRPAVKKTGDALVMAANQQVQGHRLDETR
jgi:hypothetical protein